MLYIKYNLYYVNCILTEHRVCVCVRQQLLDSQELLQTHVPTEEIQVLLFLLTQ